MVWEFVNSSSLTDIVNDSLPLKFWAGTKLTSESLINAVISSPPTILNERLSPSTSSADKLIKAEPSSSITKSWIVASIGASLTSWIVKLTLSELINSPSLTLKINESEPLKLLLGEYVAIDPSIITWPFDASVFKPKIKLSPSISLPDNVITTLISSSVVPNSPAVAIGGSFTGLIVTRISWLSYNSPSNTETMNDSEPL